MFQLLINCLMYAVNYIDSDGIVRCELLFNAVSLANFLCVSFPKHNYTLVDVLHVNYHPTIDIIYCIDDNYVKERAITIQFMNYRDTKKDKYIRRILVPKL